MKDGIHPKYGPAKIHCACGSVLETRSTIEGVIQVDVCSSCHPFFTGKSKVLDTAGRIDSFTKKFGTKMAFGAKAAKPKRMEDSSSPLVEKKEKVTVSPLKKAMEAKDKAKGKAPAK